MNLQNNFFEYSQAELIDFGLNIDSGNVTAMSGNVLAMFGNGKFKQHFNYNSPKRRV